MMEKRGPTDAELALGAAVNGLETAERLIAIAEENECLMPAHVAVEWRAGKQVIAESKTMALGVRTSLRSERGG